MQGETNLSQLLKTLKPELNAGEYVFCVTNNLGLTDQKNIIALFREKEGCTIVISKELADSLNLEYTYIAAWITLTVHSALEAVGLTAAFSNALADAGISCNVIAAYYHDHIFVAQKDADKAMEVLNRLAG